MSLSERLAGFPLAVKRSIRNGLRLTLSGSSNGITAIFMKRNIVIGALMLIVGMVIGWLCRNHFRDEVKMVQIDSVVFRDTIREYHPIEIRKEIVDTMLVIIRDTIRVKDTLYVSIPLEKKIYASSEYYAEISGYRPNLDYIEVFPKTTIITERIASKQPKNSIGVGVETSYMNALSIPIYLEYSYLLHKNVEIYGQIGYDLPSRRFGIGIGAKASIGW